MKKTLIIFLISFIVMNAQETKTNLVGVLNFDSKIAYENTKTEPETKLDFNQKKKSVFLAGAMSFLIPGSGEIYTENYYLAALFVAVEAAAITTGLIYDRKGDDQTDSYHQFAHANWDAVRYAKWTITNLSTLNGELSAANYANLFSENGTKVNWSVLNKLEMDIGGWYSHKLPAFGDQQYYELIGKYPQFNAGWSDFGDETTPYKYGDPLTAKFLYYSKERGKANDYYNIAAKAVVVVIINHVLSAVDAALAANRYNKSLNMSVDIKKTNLGYSTEFYPQLNVSYSF